ncbi:uncharacterized protein LACBIDRAFT_308479 [Laccaria bicolor S238N-H82]|uniref:Predicted protein n=1 Tax=Laccaria bicolor (strain S238N-H82 / ATCC MYA-4686) TaxID=486041 RepID=B0CWE1_LACBS|nr:uncharacterized protein LACBIDRAFT_308479 [Laccaria bicolor S238N-H82]EDR13492.1 predicted protein [Laccaria bicolor S238N-H82]|eukprot:XP_001875990.1 predicted protein [Laccaria bicolor S238N-H82]
MDPEVNPEDDDITPFTYHFPCADIHEMLSADLLHQLIKGTFKDHLVQWVGDYLYLEHGEAWANEILDDIDRHIAAPMFLGLHCFPHGCCFKQWTGDDLKALMKVYLPAISGYVPSQMVCSKPPSRRRSLHSLLFSMWIPTSFHGLHIVKFLAGKPAIFLFHIHYGVHLDCIWNGPFHRHSM